LTESVQKGQGRYPAGMGYLTQTEIEYWNRKGWYPADEWYWDKADHKDYLVWWNAKLGAEGYLKRAGGPMLPTVDHLVISREHSGGE
jgi:hypothetical protein